MTKHNRQDPAHSPEKAATILARQEYSGPAFLSGSFRPFFLGASVWAVVAIGYWLALYNGWLDALGMASGVITGRDWHIHEMLFGFGGAALAGFILTAVPNWTGRLPVRGWPLGGLAALWLLGRLVMLSGISVLMLLDLVFLFALAAVVAREIIGGRNKRNLVVAGMITLMATANLLTHLERLDIFAMDGHSWRFALAVLLTLLSLIGGRVTPSFTRNLLAKQNSAHMKPPKMPAKPGGKIDKIVMLFSALSLLVWVFAPTNTITGILLCLAGAGQLFRLSRWQGVQVMNQSIIVVLHIAYGWLGLGLILLGAAILWDGFLVSDAIHGLTIGAIGIMIAAMMSRASFGHSGLPMRAGWALTSVYALIGLAV
ncbi:MAG: NnrS family protein, partial [Robiginitomaculum sp.]|nr:NnrS family protein [Robiginitomaculum sp.]